MYLMKHLICTVCSNRRNDHRRVGNFTFWLDL